MEGPTQEEVVDQLESVVRSATRVWILEHLRDGGPASRDELRARCEASRTTLGRNLEALQERGWVREVDRRYELTTKGESATAHLLKLIDVVGVLDRLEPFLRWTSNETFDLDPRLLSDAELTVATPNDPYAPVNEHVGSLRTVESFRGLLGVIGRDAMETVSGRVEAGEATVELVVEEGVADTLRGSPHYRELLDGVLGTERFEILTTDGTVPYYLGLVDGAVQIGVEDDEGVPKALVETEAGTVREWGERTYRAYRRGARPFELHP